MFARKEILGPLRFLVGLMIVGWVRGVAADAPVFTLTPAISHSLEHRWKTLDAPNGNPGVRDLFQFVLDCAAYRAGPELAEQALARASAMREADPQSRLYGNYRWSWKDARADDPNAVEFSMQYASTAWLLYREQLSEKARAQLEAEIRYSIAGIRRHRVPVSYTNIFLMKAANCVFIGEIFADHALAADGYAALVEWIAYTRQNGIHEYSSPTYYGVDLGSLGLLARFAGEREGRENAERALRLFWTEIAAHWLPNFAGLGGAHSRDYDFLCGHGFLDTYLEKAGWLTPGKSDASEVFVALSAWQPPPALEQIVATTPRTVVQRWGEKPWEQATQYVGRHFSLGSAGAAYGPQDKILTVNLPFGPLTPIVNFAIDERGDPYGQTKVITGGGHMKLTHVVPFVASVQRGPETLLLASAKPSRTPSAVAHSLESNFVFPSSAEIWLADGPVKFAAGEKQRSIDSATTVFLRAGDVAVALRYVLALEPEGEPAPLAVIQDGGRAQAARFMAFHSPQPIEKRAVVAVWVRVAEGLSDETFTAFRHACADARVRALISGDQIDVTAESASGPLRITADVRKEERLRTEGGDASAVTNRGILVLNGRDVGAEALH